MIMYCSCGLEVQAKDGRIRVPDGTYTDICPNCKMQWYGKQGLDYMPPNIPEERKISTPTQVFPSSE